MLLEEFDWKKEVVDSAEPVLVDFWATWCGPCRRMEPVIESLSRDFKVCKVNVDTNKELVRHLNVSAYPTFLIINGGRIVASFVGVTPEVTLRSRLQQLKEEYAR